MPAAGKPHVGAERQRGPGLFFDACRQQQQVGRDDRHAAQQQMRPDDFIGIIDRGQPGKLPAAQASLIYACEPLFTSFFALFMPAWLSWLAAVNYPNEVIGAHLLLGGGLVIAANLLLLWPASKKDPALAASPPRP